MKAFLTVLFSLFITLSMYGQQDQDPEAKAILDKAKTNIESYTNLIANFELTIKNKRENINTTSTGTIFLKDSLYAIESPGSLVVFDGKQMWTYVEDVNEVTITEPSDEDSFTDNPAMIFSFYERDFKFRLRGSTELDGKSLHEIDLYPKDLNQPYSRYKILIEKATNNIYLVDAVSKDGIDYTAKITGYDTETVLKDKKFIFNPKDYPDIEVVDMRF